MCIPDFEDYRKVVLAPLLPNANFSRMSQLGENFKLFLKNNRDLEGSIYEMKEVDKKRFVHFTSLRNLFEILNSEEIRLYDFGNQDDPKEYLYSWETIKNMEDTDRIGKDNDKLFSFILSMCQIKDNDDSDYFDMWRLYGDNGSGVGIVIKIDNNPAEWDNYLLSNVLYGEKKRNNIEELFRRHEEYPGERPSNFRKGIINYIGPFHKPEIYKFEREVRLLITAQATENVRRTNPFYSYKNGKRIQYATLPLNSKKQIEVLKKQGEEEDQMKEIMRKCNNEESPANTIKSKSTEIREIERTPHLVIDTIIIGYRNNPDDYKQIKAIIDDIVIDWEGHIDIVPSKISKYF